MKQALAEFLADRGLDEDGLLQCDGFDDACIGVVERCGFQPVLCYDVDAILAALIAQGMDADEASEYYSFNIAGAYVGERTPMFLSTRPKQEDV